MKCLKCGKENDEKYCNSCFIEIIKKRVRKHLRNTQIIKPEDKLLVNDEVSLWLLNECINFPIEIINEDSKKSINSEIGRFRGILPITLDVEIHDFLEKLFSKNFNDSEIKEEPLSLLSPITNEEVLRICRLKNLKFNFPKDDDIYVMINKIESKYPGKKFSLYNSLRDMRN